MAIPSKVDFNETRAALQKAVDEGAFPGCTAAVGNADGLWWLESFGHPDQTGDRPVPPAALYDLASVTKVTGTTAVLMKLTADGRLDPASRVADHLPEFLDDAANEEETEWRRSLTVTHLLRHTGGLVSWLPFYREADSYQHLLRAVMATPLQRAPGEGFRYSDPGLILLGEIAARVGGAPLPELERKLVFDPLGMADTGRNPPASELHRIPPTERDPDGDGFIHGVVHDENARAGGGDTGHAGLFSSAEDLARFARELLRVADGRSDWLSRDLLERFITREREDLHRGLGWRLAPGGEDGDPVLSRAAFGHTGFTGTSLWIDPERGVFMILLSNRVHPTRENTRIGQVRQDFERAVIRAVSGPADGTP